MKKEEKIREEWIKAIGYFPDDCCKETGYISDNSNSVYNYFEDFCLNREDFDFKSENYGSLIRWRPNALQGIENNNGWISVNDKLPELGENNIVWMSLNKVSFIGFFYQSYMGIKYSCCDYNSLPKEIKGIHIGEFDSLDGWQPIQKPKPPIC